MSTVEFKIHVHRAAKGRVELREGAAPPPEPRGRVPRVSRLVALALHIEALVRAGKVRDYADAARLGHVSRARVAQVLSLLNLAPDIIEAILCLPMTERGRDPIGEHDLRPIAAEYSWGRQRAMWRRLATPSTR